MVEDFFNKAFDLAEEGIGFTSPNPVVGAVIVKDGKIIGKGFHAKAGDDHAEISAMKDYAESIGRVWDDFSSGFYNGLEIYVTLEPCSHVGKTGACAEVLVKAGFKSVFIAMLDPNPKVNGLGVNILQNAGMDVFVADVGNEVELEARSLNQPFLKTMKVGLPFVCLKAGVSLDGKIATDFGESKWITSKEARMDSRLRRSKFDAVIIGSGTVKSDDCELATHGKFSNKDLLRVIIDKDLDLDLGKNVFRDESVFIATTDKASQDNKLKFENNNIKFKSFGEDRVDIRTLLEFLLQEFGVQSVFVEGGSGVHGSFYDQFQNDNELIDEVCFYIAPKILGGENSKSVIGGKGVAGINLISEFDTYYVDKIGQDLLYCGYYNFW